jgi:hypothetical protein
MEEGEDAAVTNEVLQEIPETVQAHLRNVQGRHVARQPQITPVFAKNKGKINEKNF